MGGFSFIHSSIRRFQLPKEFVFLSECVRRCGDGHGPAFADEQRLRKAQAKPREPSDEACCGRQDLASARNRYTDCQPLWVSLGLAEKAMEGARVPLGPFSTAQYSHSSETLIPSR